MQGRDAYPARTAIETAWRATHHPMRDVVAALSAEQPAAPTRSPFPGVKTLAEQLDSEAIDDMDWDHEGVEDDRLRLIFTCCQTEHV